MPHYPSAEEEKAALRRYREAKLAVDRSQNTQFAPREAGGAGSSDGPAALVSYDSLYPEPDGYAGGSDIPPPFDSSGSGSQPQYLNEKERLRRQYEAQDAAVLAAQAPAPAQDAPSHTAQVPSYAGPPPEENAGMLEKEILKRRLDEQERVALLLQQQQQQQQQQLERAELLLHRQQLEQEHPTPSQTPPRVNGSRAPPVPPTLNGFKPLTAAEEKAQLRAKYATEEQGMANGHALDALPSRHPYASATPMSEPPPPPLLPRPPVEYIQETQEADIRGRYYDTLGVGLAGALDSFAPLPARIISPASNSHLEMRPFSPFDAGLMYDARLAVESPTPIHGHARSPPPPPPAQY